VLIVYAYTLRENRLKEAMMAEQTSSTFGCFPAVLVALFLSFFLIAGVQQGPVEMPATGGIEVTAQAQTEVGGRQSLTVIEQVETQVSNTVPATITLEVSGYHPDGCKFPAQVQQSRVDTQVTVKIYRIVPVDVMCTMDLNPYKDTITLEGTFESGDYTIDVNGTIVQVKV
jgi:hypothetical protein